jgi:hypothetical protein
LPEQAQSAAVEAFGFDAESVIEASCSAHGGSDIDSERASASVAVWMLANALSLASTVRKACWPISISPTANSSRG